MMGEIHQHLHLHLQQQQERQQKLKSEARPSPIFNHNHHYNYQQPQQIFQPLQNLPTTHEFFHYQPHFQAYLQQQQQQYQVQQRRLLVQDQQSAVSQDNFRSVRCIPIDLKPDLNESSRKNGGLSEEDNVNLLRGSEQYVPETRRTALAMSHCWQNQEDSAIRQPFWKNFCTDIAERKNKRGVEAKDKIEQPEMNQNKDYDYDEDTVQNSSLEAGKSRLFGELEAICGHATIGKSNQTAGSGSSLNGENLAEGTCLPPALDESNHLNANAMALTAARFGNDHGSQISAGDVEEPFSGMLQKTKKRKKMKDEMSSMAHFFERLVKQFMDHQEVLYKKFVDMIERTDKERKEREEAWRRQEMEKLRLEVAAKTHERTLASSREASIVAYLEKITGQMINLPLREPPLESRPEISTGNFNELTSTSNRSRNVDNAMSERWPKAEVEALIQIRSRLERKFQEPGLKGSLWEEISNSMASMGFQRSAKRCKEKWENINKYFKKSKENPRQKLKTCEYFDQLDQLYSKAFTNGCYGCSSSSADHQLIHTDDATPQELMEFKGSGYGKFQEIQANKNDKHGADEEIGQFEEGEEEDNEGELGEELD